MAEKGASLAIENACQQLEQEADTLEKVHNLKSLRSELRNMSSMLRKEFDDGQEYEPEVARWLHRVRDIAYETQDKIDSIAVDTKLQKRKSKLGRLLSRQHSIKHHLEEIKDIEKRIQQIPSFKDVAGSIQESSIGDTVRFRDSQDKLVTHLISGSSKVVIFIFGKEGLGKTTLAKMVYNDARIKEYFSFREWVYLPRGLSLRELLLRILTQTYYSKMNEVELMDEVELMSELSKSLRGKKYLIVMDNVCNREVYDAITSSLPDDSNGSGILLTSREGPPATLCMSNGLLHEVKPLDRSQTWELLSWKVFEGENCPSYLEDLGKRLSDRCKGCPRAIMALAAILSRAEQTEQLWTRFLQDTNQDGQILNLASLPSELLLCLLYFGLFPIDFDIPVKKIIQMWVAEGLLKQKGSKRAEEIGEDYLKELIKGSFIRVGTKKWDGRPKTCAVSNYVFHLCINEGEDHKFMVVKRNNSTLEKDNKFSEVKAERRNVAVDKGIKRLGIHNLSIEASESFGDFSSLHSLHCFGKKTDSINIDSITSNFSHLRVLNLGSMELNRVPKVVGKLIQLKYLRLRAPSVTQLPSSVGNLQYLETLDMRESCLHGRLNGIWKMKALRHLYLGGFTMPDPRGIDYYKPLLNLQTLSGVHPDKILKRLMVKAKFPNVTRLRICSSDQQAAFKFLNSLDHLSHLQSLRVEKPTNFPDDPSAFPLSLIKLTLLETRLRPGCIKKFEKLPNLKVLKLLNNSITGQEIECTAGGFLQLEDLCLEILDLEKLTLGKGAMRCLKRLSAEKCTKLTIPEDLQRVATNNIASGERNGTQ